MRHIYVFLLLASTSKLLYEKDYGQLNSILSFSLSIGNAFHIYPIVYTNN